MASLESPLAKLNRATEQCNALRRELLTFANPNIYGITKEQDADTGYALYSFEDVPPFPDAIGLRLGEMLYNFRCSLDHLVYQLVCSEGNEPTSRTEFPIFNSISEYERIKRGKLKGVSSTVMSIVDSLQPCYNTGDEYLWYLQVLCNADKHRHLLLTRRSLGEKIYLDWKGPNSIEVEYLAGTVENGAVFLRVKPDVDVDISPPVHVFFTNTPSDIRQDLGLGRICGLIKDSVINAFDSLKIHIK